MFSGNLQQTLTCFQEGVLTLPVCYMWGDLTSPYFTLPYLALRAGNKGVGKSIMVCKGVWVRQLEGVEGMYVCMNECDL